MRMSLLFFVVTSIAGMVGMPMALAARLPPMRLWSVIAIMRPSFLVIAFMSQRRVLQSCEYSVCTCMSHPVK